MGNTGTAAGRPLILAVLVALLVVVVVIRLVRGQMTGRRGVAGLIVAALVVAYVIIREFVIK